MHLRLRAGAELRKDGRFISAREQAATCARDTCPAILVRDCTRWIGELEASTGSVICEAKTTGGKTLSDVRVTVSLAAPAPDTIWVRVQDRGVGIPRKQLKRIFNRFYRVQARGIRQVKGTGLGLYIVRTIARKHGGRVFAQSEGEGRGATFTVELPRSTL